MPLFTLLLVACGGEPAVVVPVGVPVVAEVAPAAGVTLEPGAPLPMTLTEEKVESSLPALTQADGSPGIVALKYYVVDGLADASMEQRINALLSPTYVAGELDPRELESMTPTVTWNQGGVLQVRYVLSAVGAYSTEWPEVVTIDVASAVPLPAVDVFVPEKRAELVALLDGKLKALKPTHAEAAAMPEMESQLNSPFTAEELGTYELSPAGISFTHDYGVPHVAKALLDTDTLTLDWATVAPFIDPASVVAKLPGSSAAVAPK